MPDPTVRPLPELSPSDIARFWNKVNKEGPVPFHAPHLGPCWLWTGYRGKFGYGIFAADGRRVKAHRVSRLISTGENTTLHVLHDCDNPACVRPNHLRSGTPKDNSDDMVAKGRHHGITKPGCMPRGDRHHFRIRPETVARGTCHYRAQLNPEIVRDARRRFDAGEATARELAAERGVRRETMSKVVHRITWKHVS